MSDDSIHTRAGDRAASFHPRRRGPLAPPRLRPGGGRAGLGRRRLPAHRRRPRAPGPLRRPRRGLEALRAALDGAAAMIVEPVQGMAGAVDLGAEYLAAARELTREAGALLVFDEVQCGMGRTGHPFAAQLYGVTPDVLTTAKGLAGGFPAGAVLVSDAVAAGLRKGDLGSTFSGGPLACALIETVIDTIESEGLL